MIEENPWKKRFERERAARKEAEQLLEAKSAEVYEINKNLEKLVYERTIALEEALKSANIAKEAKSNFLAKMSHEIRTPMNGIIGFTQLISQTDLNEKQEEYINIITSSTQTLLSVINDILDYSKIESGKLVPEIIETNILEELNNIFSLFKNSAKAKNINYILSIDDKIDTFLYSDIHKIKQVVSNLINNALKFTPENKKVSLNISLLKDDLEYQEIVFYVEDEGIGIPLDKQKKIFEAFSQADESTSRKYGGTGLGLNISSSIINLLGGTLEVESIENIGSKFFFTLKLKKCKNISTKDLTKITIPKLNNNDLKILVVDDNQVNLLIISEVLKKLNINYLLAENGQIAIDLCKENLFDIILMDINMPILNGLEATNILKNQYKIKTPIIALTANSLEGDKNKYLEEGFDDYLSKPFNINDFLELVKKFLIKN
jgi:signal transduction histidine kinase